MTDDEMRIVARALFDAENEWRRMQGGLEGEPMEERMFKVQIVYWLMMAREAIAAVDKIRKAT